MYHEFFIVKFHQRECLHGPPCEQFDSIQLQKDQVHELNMLTIMFACRASKEKKSFLLYLLCQMTLQIKWNLGDHICIEKHVTQVNTESDK